MSSDTSSLVVLATEELTKRIDAFANAIGVDAAIVRDKLAEEGVDVNNPEQAITILDNDDYLPFADLAKQFLDTKLTKKAPLRLGISHLRGKTTLSEPNGHGLGELANAVQDMAKANRPISSWRDRELLEAYDSNSPHIHKELNERAHGRHCIVFEKNEQIDVDASLNMLQIAKRQTTSDKMRIGSDLRRVYRSGEVVEKPLDASPFYLNEPLINDYCPKSDTDWKGVPHERRVILRIQVMEIEKKELSQRVLRTLWNDALDLDQQDFQSAYGQAFLLYGELKEQSKLPTLKLMRRNINKKVDSGF